MFYDCINTMHQFINTMHQFIKPFLDNKMSIFEEYGAFKKQMHKKQNFGNESME